ncbi:hypothetical protein WA026_005498 [Henosepilachna vigintioctopunctata]|uniref:Methyltransferase domain-containing protein n=1 Tax=Henosepilachna vigintioctopunctata TaxID=420089 RepID=A0AAW1U153_9CUCU
MNSIELVQHYIEKVLFHLQPLLPLANCHMVDFFTKNIFKTTLSDEMTNEINSIPHYLVCQNILEGNFTNIPILKKYFESCSKCTLLECKNICLTLEEYYNKMESLGYKNMNRFKLDIFMSQKKSHEVEILSSVVASLKHIGYTSHVIDIGDGKGYLSSMLALHHKIPVLGIDASANNSDSAVKRVKKLEKVWNTVYDSPKKSVPKRTESNFTSSHELYKQITKFVEPDTNFNEMMDNIFNEKIDRISLVGLHTCGNLAATSIKIFTQNTSVRTLANVGCCYHLLNEKFEYSPAEHIVGFPMSDYLLKKQVSIGRNARMVAAQSVNRIFHKKELPDISIFYRALLQVVLENECKQLPCKTVGKMKKKYKNFVEYVRMAVNKLELENFDVSDQDLQKLHDNYKPRLDELNIFYLIRSVISPVIENLILLDRLLFLLEQGYDKSFIVQLFDAIISPRCYGIISIKT